MIFNGNDAKKHQDVVAADEEGQHAVLGAHGHGDVDGHGHFPESALPILGLLFEFSLGRVAETLLVVLGKWVRPDADGEADLLPHDHNLIYKFVEFILLLFLSVRPGPSRLIVPLALRRVTPRPTTQILATRNNLLMLLGKLAGSGMIMGTAVHRAVAVDGIRVHHHI